MHPIFIGHGPAFKHGYKSASFDNVDIYPLMCALLNIEAPHNDGNMDHVKHLLVKLDNSSVTLLTCKFVFLYTEQYFKCLLEFGLFCL